jgi:hypothetical protein
MMSSTYLVCIEDDQTMLQIMEYGLKLLKTSISIFYVTLSSVVLEICALMGCYTVENVSFVPTFQDQLSVPSSRANHFLNCFTLEGGTYRLSQNVSMKLTFYDAQNLKWAQI